MESASDSDASSTWDGCAAHFLAPVPVLGLFAFGSCTGASLLELELDDVELELDSIFWMVVRTARAIRKSSNYIKIVYSISSPKNSLIIKTMWNVQMDQP